VQVIQKIYHRIISDQLLEKIKDISQGKVSIYYAVIYIILDKCKCYSGLGSVLIVIVS